LNRDIIDVWLTREITCLQDPRLLAQLFANQKDEATLMKEAMAAILDPATELSEKEIAFDNFEMMIEQLDNANNIDNLKLWGPLIGQLSAPEKEMRFMAAWCCGTAVQNNPKSQEAFVKNNGVPKIVELVLKDPAADVRKKAVYALSSAIRNSQAAMKIALEHLPDEFMAGKVLDADDMDGIDTLMTTLRELEPASQ
jgi:hsp70-interacting protein